MLVLIRNKKNEYIKVKFFRKKRIGFYVYVLINKIIGYNINIIN